MDIKTTAKLSYSNRDWTQVFGYAAMAQAAGFDIRQVGVYFARFDVCAMYADSSKLSQFLPGYLDAILQAAGYAHGVKSLIGKVDVKVSLSQAKQT